jgi:hypothetical protein
MQGIWMSLEGEFRLAVEMMCLKIVFVPSALATLDGDYRSFIISTPENNYSRSQLSSKT